MKTIQIFKITIIAVISLIGMMSCSSDDEQGDNNSAYPANAKGVCLYYDDDYIEAEDYYLWLNDYVVKYVAREANIDITQNEERNTSYYPLTMDIVYELLSDFYGEEITENTDFGTLSPNPKKLIQYIKSNKSKYRYIMPYNGDFVLFNRTSDKNY